MVILKRDSRRAKRRNITLHKSVRKLNILRIILAIRETSAPYNQFSLSWADVHKTTICTYFPSEVAPPPSITVFEGDGTIRGFLRTLNAALIANQYDVIHVHSPHLGLMFHWATLIYEPKYMPPRVITVHDSYQNYKLRNRLMFIPVFASFDRIVCCGQASFDSFPAVYKWLAGERLCVVHNSLDLARVDRIAADFHKRNELNSEFTVAAVSRLVEIKNPFSVLNAFQQVADQNSRLLYMGDGPLREALIAHHRQRGSEARVEFTGLIPRESVFENLLNADLFISTSRGEGLPIAVLEAMACRRPVLLSNIPPHVEIAQGADFIPLIDPNDTAGFAREIKRFRDMSQSERSAIGQACRALVEERFSLHAMHRAYEAVYSQVLRTQAVSLLET
jgi:glycosyltransferase involved in cell wall biosynthesis